MPNSETIDLLALKDIEFGTKLRPLVQSDVEALALSMSVIGLQSPIPVVKIAGWGRKFRAVSGAHRYAAAALLGWKTIPAIVMSKSDAEIFQYSENLHRSDLRALDRFDFIRKYDKAVNDRKNVIPLQPHDKGVSDTARKLGIDRKLVRTARKLGDLSSKLRQVLRASGGDNNARLLTKIASTDNDEDQMRLAEGLKAPRKAGSPSTKAKPILTIRKPQSVAVLLNAWNASEVRAIFEQAHEMHQGEFARVTFGKHFN